MNPLSVKNCFKSPQWCRWGRAKWALARTLAKDWPDDAAYLERPADRLRLEDADTYVRDSGLLHGLLELETLNHLLGHPVCGLGHGRAGDWFAGAGGAVGAGLAPN